MHDEKDESNKITLELYFIVAVGLIVCAAFFSASSYEFVSARTPIVIMCL